MRAKGERVGPYELLSPLGAGGMGEVWKARDKRLDRIVAIKFPQAQFSDRFEREARTIAALNHPNLAQIYDVGDDYIVMEYIDGEPVHPLEDARKVLDAAVQMADGLAAAHAAGVVHRDLKPGNVLLTSDGRVKILDFGLAKRAAAAAADATATFAITEPGAIMGTVAYMSPEQARGKPVDHRSDQFSFGLIIYEMLSNRRAFERPSAAETLTAIIREDAEPMPTTAPAALRWTVERCLAKDPGQRYDSTRDLFRELCQVRNHLTEAHTVAGAAVQRPSRAAFRVIVAAVVLSVLVGGVALGRWLADRNRDVREWTGIQLGGPGIAMRPVVSPDGQLLAFSAMVDDQTQLAVMKPDSGNWTVLTHDRNAGMQARASWAADGSRIYFDRVWGGPRGVYAISPLGGEPRLVLDRAQCPRALPDGSLIVAMIDQSARYRLFRLWPDSGKLQPLPALLGGGVSQLVDPLVQAFPDGREVLYLGSPEAEPNSLPHWNAIDLETLRSRPMNIHNAARGFAIAVSPDNRSALFVKAEEDQWSIAAVPRSGTDSPRTLISFPRPYNVWGLDAARDGSVYFDYMIRQTAVIEFDAAGKPVAESVAAIDAGLLIQLQDGSYLCDYSKSRKRQLRVIRAGTGSGNLLLESSDESTGPAAKVGADAVAFLLGPEDSRHIAIATLREGRIIRRFPFDASAVTSMAATPDGEKLYYCDHGQVWVLGGKADEGAKPAAITTGDSVAIDGSGKYLYVKRTRAEHRALVRIPMAGGQAETLAIPPEYTLSEDTLSPAAVDASGRVLVEVDSADSWFERVAMIDPSRKTFEVIRTGFHGDVWMPGWESSGHIAAIGVRLDSSLWRYSPSRAGAK